MDQTMTLKFTDCVYLPYKQNISISSRLSDSVQRGHVRLLILSSYVLLTCIRTLKHKLNISSYLSYFVENILEDGNL